MLIVKYLVFMIPACNPCVAKIEINSQTKLQMQTDLIKVPVSFILPITEFQEAG